MATPKTPGRKPGLPKTGGRVKGSVNKNTIFARETLDKMDFNVIEELIGVWREIADPQAKFSALQAILPYLLPKLKEIEVSATDLKDSLNHMSDEDLMNGLGEDDMNKLLSPDFSQGAR